MTIWVQVESDIKKENVTVCLIYGHFSIVVSGNSAKRGLVH